MDNESARQITPPETEQVPEPQIAEKTGPKNEEQELAEKIDNEIKEAHERFREPLEIVRKRYAEGIFSPEEQEAYVKHVEDDLADCVEYALKFEILSREEMDNLELAAIFHDLTKADKPRNDIGFPLNVVDHGQNAAQELPKILTDEFFAKMGISRSPEENDAARTQIQSAIREHMGPNPGFMADLLKTVNAKLAEKGLEPIVHPPAKGKISKILLAADMRALADESGWKKVLANRAKVPGFMQVDQREVEKYKEAGVELLQGEAAVLSAYDSAIQAKEMFKEDQKMSDWVNEVIKDAQEKSYSFSADSKNPQIVTFRLAIEKRDKFNQLQAEAQAREKIKEISRKTAYEPDIPRS